MFALAGSSAVIQRPGEAAHGKLLEAVVLMEEVQERRKRAMAAFLEADAARGFAQALTAESAQARRHGTQARRDAAELVREAAALVARAERLIAEAGES